MSAQSQHPDSQPAGDPFGRVLGTGRGLNDTTVSHEQARAIQEQLAQTVTELQAERDRACELQDRVGALTVRLDAAIEHRNDALSRVRDAESAEQKAVRERDRARYAAMRAGLPDPCSYLFEADTHQGEWTPGRPFLAYQHAWHPKTRECYRASSTGAPTGEIPGTGRHWERCLNPDLCPSPFLSLGTDPQDTPTGPVLRRTELPWGGDSDPRPPRELAYDEMENAISFLRKNAADMCFEESLDTELLVPCPVNAYPSAAAWLADTPLMRALQRNAGGGDVQKRDTPRNNAGPRRNSPAGPGPRVRNWS